MPVGRKNLNRRRDARGRFIRNDGNQNQPEQNQASLSAQPATPLNRSPIIETAAPQATRFHNIQIPPVDPRAPRTPSPQVQTGSAPVPDRTGTPDKTTSAFTTYRDPE